MKIPTSQTVIREIKGIWSDNFKAKKVSGPNQCELFVTLEKSSMQRARYAAMGNVYEFLKESKPEVTFKVLWAPQFCVYAESHTEDMRPALVVTVNAENAVVWEPASEKVLGVSINDALGLLAVFRRK